MCLSRTADAAGNVIPYGLGTFQNLGDGLLGRELLDMDLSDPDHLVFSLVTPDGALGIRYRIAYSDPSRIEQEARTIDGQPTWITLPVYPPTPNGGPPQPTGDPVKDAQIAASWATYNQTLGMSWLLAAGADLRITV
jgi:hypothetical protein